jgi:GH43 family beta-xylosidase
MGDPFLARNLVDVADPFVLAVDDWYYLYHTGHDVGIPVYRSRDLIAWSSLGLALSPDPRVPWAACDFWAPEVIFRDGRFFMYVAVASTLPDGSPDDENRRLAVAHSDGPEGPFTLSVEPLIDDEWAIDAHPFQDDDGSWWLYYNVRNEETRYTDGTIGCGNAVTKLTAPQSTSDESRTILRPTERWEGNGDGSWYWNEGAFVVRRGGKLVQTYSGGWFADGTYAIGTATAERPDGPWRKNVENPLLVSSDRVVGPGHNCIVTGPDGFTTFLVYHAHVDGQPCRAAFMTEMHWVGDGFVLTGQSPAHPAPGGYHPAVPFWRIDATLAPGRYRMSAEPVSTAHAARLQIRSTMTGVSGRLDGHPLPISLATVEECIAEIAEGASHVRVRSGVNQATELKLSAGDAVAIPWAPDVAAVVNVVVAGPAVLGFGEDARVCASETPHLIRIESARGGSELLISAKGTVRVTGIEMVPAHAGDQQSPRTADGGDSPRWPAVS